MWGQCECMRMRIIKLRATYHFVKTGINREDYRPHSWTTAMDWSRYGRNRKRLLGLGLFFVLICAVILLLTPRCRQNSSGSSSRSSNNQNCRCEFPFLGNLRADPSRTPLVLTPYIQNGEISTAQLLSYVGNWKGVESYAGFLTVKVQFNSNLFFWFFPAETQFPSSKPAPLILYLQGGPSLSSLLGLFMESGPFKVAKVDSKLELHRNAYSWHRKHSLLYIDSPSGTGFSFASSVEAYATGQEDVGRDLYTALLQFFKLFPELRVADFYIMGTSYAGKYIPTTAYKIHLENSKNPQDHINLKGLAIGSGYFHFEGLVEGAVSTYYYNVGFLDKAQRQRYEETEVLHGEHYKLKNYNKARDIIGARSYLHLYAGFNNFLGGNALQMKTPPLDFYEFLNHDCVQTALHIGTTNFSYLNQKVFDKFDNSDYMTSVKFELEQLLDANYRVLIYNAQFDVIIPHTVVENFITNLSWTGTSEFTQTNRGLWLVGREIAGFVTETNSTRLTMILLRNSGHTACSDQPAWCFEMINRFTNGDSFRTYKLELDKSAE